MEHRMSIAAEFERAQELVRMGRDLGVASTGALEVAKAAERFQGPQLATSEEIDALEAEFAPLLFPEELRELWLLAGRSDRPEMPYGSGDLFNPQGTLTVDSARESLKQWADMPAVFGNIPACLVPFGVSSSGSDTYCVEATPIRRSKGWVWEVSLEGDDAWTVAASIAELLHLSNMGSESRYLHGGDQFFDDFPPSIDRVTVNLKDRDSWPESW